MCACNPPYFTEGPQSQNAAHALARHENTCALEDVCACGFRLLKDGGRLALKALVAGGAWLLWRYMLTLKWEKLPARDLDTPQA